MMAAKKIEDLSHKQILTYEEYIQIWPGWSEKTIERRMEDDNFPAKKIRGKLYFNRKECDLYWKKRGL